MVMVNELMTCVDSQRERMKRWVAMASNDELTGMRLHGLHQTDKWCLWTDWRMAPTIFLLGSPKWRFTVGAFVIVTCYALLGNRQIDIFVGTALTALRQCFNLRAFNWSYSCVCRCVSFFSVSSGDIRRNNVVALCDQGDRLSKVIQKCTTYTHFWYYW